MMGLALAPAVQTLAAPPPNLTVISYAYFVIIGLFVVKYMLETDRLDGVLFDLNKVPARAEFSFMIARILCLLAVCLFVQYILVDGSTPEKQHTVAWLSKYGIFLTSILLLLSYGVQDATTLLVWRSWLGTKGWSTLVPDQKINNGDLCPHNSVPLFMPYTISIKRMASLLLLWLRLDFAIFLLVIFSMIQGLAAQGNGYNGYKVILEALLAAVLFSQIFVPFWFHFNFYFGSHTKPDESVFHILQSMSEKVKLALSTPFLPPQSVGEISEMLSTTTSTTKRTEQKKVRYKFSDQFLDDYIAEKLPQLIDRRITKTAKENVGLDRLFVEDGKDSIVTDICTSIVHTIKGGNLFNRFEKKRKDTPRLPSRQILEETLDQFIGDAIAEATCRFAPVPCRRAFDEMVKAMPAGTP